MPKRLTIAPHLSVEELEIHYRRASNPIERTRYQIVWLLAQGRASTEVAAVTGYSLEVVRRIARRYNKTGSQALTDRRQIHPGPEPMLSPTQQAHLWQALSGAAPDGGLWNGRKVADWIGELIGQPVGRQRGWEYLRQMTFRLVSHVHNIGRLTLKNNNSGKKLAVKLEEIQAQYPQADVELWAMDEHRLGPGSVVRRVWTPEGQQAIANVNWRFQWLWVYGFVHPQSGETYWWILPQVNTLVIQPSFSRLRHTFSTRPAQAYYFSSRSSWLAHQLRFKSSGRHSSDTYAFPLA
ncbi:IS630 family transposase [Microseira sp. BLCC-F43]|jgi:transposase|uniref:IS630 family transposase n=1 Tax=Microseira sp. BLCC-F43 TaxID=3153602 RepID=UPI0035BA29BC